MDIIVTPPQKAVIQINAQQALEVRILQQPVQVIEINKGESNIAAVFPIIEEALGVVNGINAIFTSTYPFKPETLQVFVNGLLQKKLLDYNNTDTQNIQFTFSPLDSENITLTYYKL